ncbi:MAG: HAMP domain-containing protein [Eubacteriales bacterium]|nr:HAMP domain-containing protein [Eubacteriales bacterium]
MRNKIALRLMLYFAVALIAFALVSGVLFQSLFTRYTVDAKKEEMLARATTLAQALSEVLAENGGGRMNGAQGAGYGNYVRILSLVETDVWVLDENLSFLTIGHTMSSAMGNTMGNTLTYDDLPADAEALVNEVFQGKTPFSEGFSDLMGTPTLTVGAPIYQGETVAGALLLHDAVSGISAAVTQGIRVLLYSSAAALVVAAALAMLLSYSFARPLNRMKAAATKLSGGDYTARTGVRRNDEIGKLAQAMDGLSERLRDAREAGEREEQQRRDFLSNVSHELRTPVTVLRGSLEALGDGVVTDPKQIDEYHRQMLKETLGLQRLVNDLMDLSRLQNADFPIESAPLIVNDVLGDALYAADQLARAKKIRLVREFPNEAVRLTGDYGRLRQMFLIVLDNAVKFSPENSAVTVTLTPDSVTIRDEGQGISSEELPLIFDRFHKARLEENRQGSGLGLAIARQIAQRHSIHIDVASELGRGTAFRFSWQPQPQPGDA